MLYNQFGIAPHFWSNLLGLLINLWAINQIDIVSDITDMSLTLCVNGPLRSIHTKWFRHCYRNITWAAPLTFTTAKVTGILGCIPIFAYKRYVFDGVVRCAQIFTMRCSPLCTYRFLHMSRCCTTSTTNESLHRLSISCIELLIKFVILSKKLKDLFRIQRNE